MNLEKTTNQMGELLTECLETVAKGGMFGIGLYSGMMVPDLDISNLGIGYHRNFIYHSAAPTIIIQQIRRAISRQIREKYPNKVFSEEVLALFTAGFALGQAGHLLADATWEGGRAILWRIPRIFNLTDLTGSNSLISGTLTDDHFWLFGNTILALKIAWEELKFALGEEHPMIRSMKWIGKKLEKAFRYVIQKVKELVKKVDDTLKGEIAYDRLESSCNQLELTMNAITSRKDLCKDIGIHNTIQNALLVLEGGK